MGLSQEEVRDRIEAQKREQENIAQTAIAFIRQRFAGSTLPEKIGLRVRADRKSYLLLLPEWRQWDTCDLHAVAVAVLNAYRPMTLEISSREAAVAILESNKPLALRVITHMAKHKRKKFKAIAGMGFDFCHSCENFAACLERDACTRATREARETVAEIKHDAK